ncbi:MAG: hypothetical protein RL508_1094 [Actinomycetota bacterium]|jgi:4-diphosphocytidyl-2-C-methyl-D-erythritol kinase
MQHWSIATSKSGWFTAESSRFFGADLPRLFALFQDPASWPVAAPQRLIRIVQSELLGYSFENQSRVEITFEQIRKGMYRVAVVHEHLHDSAELAWAQQYWESVFQSIFDRLLCEPVHAAISYGKINLFFKVGPLQEDGYHQVSSLYQSVKLSEIVMAELASDWEVAVTGTIGEKHLAAVPTNRNNLVVAAAKAAGKALKYRTVPRLAFTIHKNVPVAGGMGGGSADAAAALLAAQSVWGKWLSMSELDEVAATIGADVPFALMGGSAIGEGTGHELTPVAQKSLLHWVLVPNDFGLSTPAVYAELDRLRAERGEDPASVPQAQMDSALIKALREGATAEEIAPLLHNDLEEAAISLRPELKQLLEMKDQVFALRAIVSGSGPTVAMLARDSQDAIAIASRLTTYGQQAVITSSPAGASQLVF